MDLIQQALRASRSPVGTQPGARPSVVVAGGAGALGSAVVEKLLASRGFAHVRVLVSQDFHATVQGMETRLLTALDDAQDPSDTGDALMPIGDTALIVFDRERHANGRDAAFFRPVPEQLPALARWLHRRGVQRLIVVLPHSAALLPEALKAGLANLDEHAVSALGFTHLVIVRSAQAPDAASGARGLQRLADLVLAQLRIMTPQNQQPVRAAKVAQLVVALAQALPFSEPGTRVMAPEWVWQAAQLAEPEVLLRAWLAGEMLPDIGIKVPRM
jgi:hypothetical protein